MMYKQLGMAALAGAAAYGMSRGQGRRAGWERKFQRRPQGDLPSRAEELAAAWRYSREELLRGRIGSLEAAKERRLILREAENEGILDEVVALTTGPHTRDLDAWGQSARGRRDEMGYDVDRLTRELAWLRHNQKTSAAQRRALAPTIARLEARIASIKSMPEDDWKDYYEGAALEAPFPPQHMLLSASHKVGVPSSGSSAQGRRDWDGDGYDEREKFQKELRDDVLLYAQHNLSRQPRISATKAVDEAIEYLERSRGQALLYYMHHYRAGLIKDILKLKKLKKLKSKGSSARGRKAKKRASKPPTMKQRRTMGQKLQSLPWNQASALYKRKHPQYKGIGGYPMNTRIRAEAARGFAVMNLNKGLLTQKDVKIIFRRTGDRYPGLPTFEGLSCKGTAKRRKCHSVTTG